jgi:translation elongation factor aEF-1 beta
MCGKNIETELQERKTMGKIVIAYKIFPAESTVNLESLKEEITKQLSNSALIKAFAEEPIAFGLCALIVKMVLPEDKSGILDEVENRMNKIEGIGQIQTLMVNRM